MTAFGQDGLAHAPDYEPHGRGPNKGTVRENRLEPEFKLSKPAAMNNPFRYFNSSPKVIRRDVFKQHRTAALAEWRQLAA